MILTAVDIIRAYKDNEIDGEIYDCDAIVTLIYQQFDIKLPSEFAHIYNVCRNYVNSTYK